MNACMHACLSVCMSVCLYVCLSVCTYVRMYVCVRTSVCMCVVRTYVRTYVRYVRTYVCMYACMHVCVQLKDVKRLNKLFGQVWSSKNVRTGVDGPFSSMIYPLNIAIFLCQSMASVVCRKLVVAIYSDLWLEINVSSRHAWTQRSAPRR